MGSAAVMTLLIIWTGLRVAELCFSIINTLRLLQAGFVESCRRQHPILLATTGLAGILAAAAHSMDPTVTPAVQQVALWLFIAFESLHTWSILTLGRRWTTGVLVGPHEEPVRRGPYRWLTHPGYLGGATAAALLPLAAGVWQFSLLAGMLLWFVVRARIRCEDAAWAASR
jgi:methyltransferase